VNLFLQEQYAERDPIEKETHGGSLHRKSPLKSPGVFAEEILVRVERHGNARYSMG
jgi:hypothetical protein